VKLGGHTVLLVKKEESKSTVDQVIDRNVQALIDLRRRHDANRRFRDRAVDAIAAFTGSPPFVYLHLALLAFWGLFCRGWMDLHLLADLASVEAIFLASLLMINQNRLKLHEQKREDLDLQVSLLIEHELTHLARTCNLIAKQVGVAGMASDLTKQGLTDEIPPAKVLERIEAVEKTNSEEENS
jgi:uncharacterized membrane protein